MIDALLHALLTVPDAAILGIVFLLPALEASTLIGVIVPGESAILLGGVLAAYGKLSIWGVALAASAGAVVGDSVGYWVGKRFGERSVNGRLGRFVGEQRWERARQHLRRKGFAWILIGRFPPAIRSLVPIAAGMARMPYGRFLAGNLVGGVIWASASAALGYFAGDAWRSIEAVHATVGIVMGVLVIAAAVWLYVRARRRKTGAGGRP